MIYVELTLCRENSLYEVFLSTEGLHTIFILATRGIYGKIFMYLQDTYYIQGDK